MSNHSANKKRKLSEMISPNDSSNISMKSIKSPRSVRKLKKNQLSEIIEEVN